MIDKYYCSTVILSDRPSNEDDFGSHRRIAQAIARLVDKEIGGKAIALEGKWGSGKSTIINLLNERLKENSNHCLIVFDAWAHQGDPLRRTVLESMIKSLQKKQWIEIKKWNVKRQELAQRRKIKTLKSFPKLGVFGTIVAIGLLLIPLGVTLLTSAFNEGISLNIFHGIKSGAEISWKGLLGFLFTVNPFLILIVYLIKNKFFKENSTDEKNKDIKPIDEFGAFLVSKHITEERTETIENPDPTSVEFEEMFFDLMNEALSDSNKRIIIALDNLDRVQAMDALSILSTLQTFLQRSQYSFSKWFEQLWILIPYDPLSLKTLWDSQSQKENVNFNNSENLRQTSYQTSYIDKLFQIKFEVPPLLLSDWHTYLQNLLNKALPNHSKKDFHCVYRVYSNIGVHRGDLPTPRDLKLFVNQIGSIHMQWGDEFPLSQIAYFTLLIRDGIDIRSGLIKGTIPSAEISNILGTNARVNIAAMFFNADINTARQLLLENPLTEALSNGDDGNLSNLSKLYPKGLWEVMENIPFRDWSSNEGYKLANTAKSLSKTGIIDEAKKDYSTIVDSILSTLVEAVSICDNWFPFSQNIAEGLIALVKLTTEIDKSDLIKKIMVGLGNTPLYKEGEENDRLKSINTFANGMQHFAIELDKLGYENALQNGISINGSSEDFLQLCLYFIESALPQKFWPILFPKATSSEIAETIIQVIKNGELNQNYITVIKMIKTINIKIDWNLILQNLLSRLKNPGKYTPEEIKGLIGVTLELEDVAETWEQEVEQLITSGAVLHHIHHTYSNNDDLGTAFLLLIQLDKSPVLTGPPALGSSPSGHSFINNNLFSNSPSKYIELTRTFVQLLPKYKRFNLLWNVFDANPRSHKWVILCITQALEMGFVRKIVTSRKLIEKWSVLSNNLEDSQLIHLIRELNIKGDLVNEVQKDEFDTKQSGLYSTIIHSNGVSNKNFLSWCKDGLNNISKNDWIEELTNETDTIGLLITMIEHRFRPNLQIAFQDALAEYAKQVMQGSVSPVKYLNAWSDLTKALKSKDSRKALRRQVLQNAEFYTGEVSSLFFDLCGDELINDPKIIIEDNQVVQRFFRPLLEKQNYVGIAWLANLFKKNEGLFDKCKPSDVVQDFKDRISAAIQKEGESIHPELVELAKAIGINTTINTT